jgi:hypothetical protein
MRSLRRRILTPSTTQTLMSVRGFHVKSDEGRDLLEMIGATFLKGYSYAAEAKTVAEAEERLEEVPKRFKGFAYEGAGMGYAVRDGLPVGGTHHFEQFLAGRARAHQYMVWVGLGWAMARLPRFRWPDPAGTDPLLRWLVLDGYGFHQAYFKTGKYVHEQYQNPKFPWPGGVSGGYAPNAIDQGIGRALWFVGGTDPKTVADLIDAYPEHRHSDLYAGAGLALAYAGGVDAAELRVFWNRAGRYRPQVAQGVAFAATARAEAGLVVPHTELALSEYCDIDVEKAWLICAESLPDPIVDGDVPAYETWRRTITERLLPTLRG